MSRKSLISSLVACAVIAATLAASTAPAHAAECASVTTPFTDLPGDWADESIACIYDLGVTTGTSPTTFSPGEPVTRMQMAGFLARLYEALGGTCSSAIPRLDDLPTQLWALHGISCVYGLGIQVGSSHLAFAPAEPVTRMQMAEFLSLLYEALGRTCDTTAAPFSDMGAEAWAIDAISCIYNIEVTTGTSPTTFSPDALVTRKQLAAFLARLYEAV